MNKPVFGLLLGGILGIFDGLSALVSAPETAPGIVGIVIGSCLKGVIAGVLIGLFARKVRSLPLGILFGLVVGAFLAFLVAQMQGKYYLEIILPGSLVGVIVGYATQKHREAAKAVAAFLLLFLAPIALRAQTPVDAKAAYEALKGLAGTWEGTAMKEDGPPAKVVYTVSANGNVVTETLFPGTEHEMLTLYYLEGNDLRATHYCAMGNRPQFKLDPAASKPGELVFAFAGGSGFDAAKDPHVHSGAIRLQGDRLDNDWAYWVGGKQAGDNRVFLKRAR